MTIPKDDPRLTAYALDAMEGEERRAFEGELESDPSAREEVEAIRALGADLERELEGEPVPRLEIRQRRRLADAARGRTGRRTFSWWAPRVAAVLVIALIPIVLIPLLVSGERQYAALYSDTSSPAVAERAILAGAVAPEEEPEPAAPAGPFDTETYDRIRENPFFHVADRNISTFSIDVDTASYANVRRFLDQEGRLPPTGAVRIEELVNYFHYDYDPPPPDAERPFAVHAAVAACPWKPEHRLVRIGLKGKTFETEERPPANLVFLLDVSGSMARPNKLPLLKQSMKLLVDRMEPEDRVAIAVYAGAAGLVLPSTSGTDKARILTALDRLRAGGSTNGGAGIQLAYRVAAENHIEGGVNRVILCTDGDFNVGVSDRGSLTRLIEEKAKSGVFLSVLGFGTGNYKDAAMEELSNVGNGNYAYVDTLREARKVLVEQRAGTLVTIAKDVKVQVFFNPQRVAGWRLIGYENRLLRKEDFKDDTKDAGEIGAGHTVTALYEVVPFGAEVPGPRSDPNPFVAPPSDKEVLISDAILQVHVRYKPPEGDRSVEMIRDVFDPDTRFEDTDVDFQWAAAVAGFGMMLRRSEHKGDCTWELVEEIAGAARGRDPGGYRAEFLQLVRLAADLSAR